MFAQLPCAGVSQRTHVRFRPEPQTTGRTRLDARRLQTLPHTIRAQRAFVDLLRGAIELRNVERTTGHAVLTPDAVLLLEIDDTVGVLDDRAVGATRAQTA